MRRHGPDGWLVEDVGLLVFMLALRVLGAVVMTVSAVIGYRYLTGE